MIVHLLFYRPRNWWQHTVCFFGRMKYVHVAVSYNDGRHRPWGTDSTPRTGVRKRALADCPHPDDTKAIQLILEQAVVSPGKYLDEWVDSELHQRYGFWDAAQAVIRRWTGLKVGGNPGGMTCSEYAARLLAANGGPVIDWEYGITPDELWEAL